MYKCTLILVTHCGIYFHEEHSFRCVCTHLDECALIWALLWHIRTRFGTHFDEFAHIFAPIFMSVRSLGHLLCILALIRHSFCVSALILALICA